MENISYEHRFYESVDDKSLFWVISKKLVEKIIHAAKGYSSNIDFFL